MDRRGTHEPHPEVGARRKYDGVSTAPVGLPNGQGKELLGGQHVVRLIDAPDTGRTCVQNGNHHQRATRSTREGIGVVVGGAHLGPVLGSV